MTGRPRELLTLSDLHALVQIVAQRPPSLVAAARLVGFDRARLMRLIGRVNAQIGADLSWRHEGGFSPPIEARRIAAAFVRFEAALAEVSGSPRISAGVTLAVLLMRLIQGQGRTLEPPLAIFRSREILDALRDDRVDLAFVQSESPLMRARRLEFTAAGHVVELGQGLEASAVAAWTARLITSHRASCGAQACESGFATLEWEPATTGAQLTESAGLANDPRGLRIRCQSFLEAMDLVRWGCAEQAVIPDLYLRGRENDFAIDAPPCAVSGYLVAVYRAEDRGRWEQLLNIDDWRRL